MWASLLLLGLVVQSATSEYQGCASPPMCESISCAEGLTCGYIVDTNDTEVGCGVVGVEIPTLNNCMVTGCSGELCSNAEEFSACMWKPEYSCLKFASCERVENSCAWNYTQEYTSCVENI